LQAIRKDDVPTLRRELRSVSSQDSLTEALRIAVNYPTQEPPTRGVIVSLLIDRGARVDWGTEDLETPLMWACRNDNQDLVRKLIMKGAQIDARGVDGGAIEAPPPARRTALMQAAYAGDPEIVELLLRSGAKPSLADDAGVTALMLATIRDRTRIMKDLLKAGCDANAKHHGTGRTALMLAALLDRGEAAKLLLTFGADKSSRDSAGATALEIAQVAGSKRVIALLTPAP
jgi:ankyrin repeat protein